MNKEYLPLLSRSRSLSLSLDFDLSLDLAPLFRHSNKQNGANSGRHARDFHLYTSSWPVEEATRSLSSGTPTRRGKSSPLRDTDISSAQSSHISISSLSSGRLVRVTSKELPSSPYNIPMYHVPPSPTSPSSSSSSSSSFVVSLRPGMFR